MCVYIYYVCLIVCHDIGLHLYKYILANDFV